MIFCGISEHWLFEKDLHFLAKIDNLYNSYTVLDNDLKHPGSRRVGKGGVAILWHIKYDKNIYPLPIDYDRVIGARFETETGVFFFQPY